jgi:fatty-acyl-CoA synthase
MHSHDHYVVMLLSALATRPDDPVIWWRDRRITASELRHSIMSAAVVLRRAGLDETGTVTLLMSGNNPDVLTARYAANLLGATVIHGQSVNAAHPLDELSIEAQADILSESDTSVLIVDAQNVERGREVSAKMATRPRLAMLTSGDAARSDDIVDLSSAPGSALFDIGTAVSGIVATVSYTSGSTGRPKGVPRTFAAWSSLMAPSSPMRNIPDGTVLIVTPVAKSLFADKELVGNGAVVLHDGFEASAVLAAIAKHRVTRLYLAPPQLYQLVDQLPRTSTDTSSLKQIIYAGCTASPRRITRALDAFGPILAQLYGTTEGGMISMLLPSEHTPKLLTTVGRPIHGVAIRDERTGEDLRVGQTGEVCVRRTMDGYWRDPEATRQRFRDGWFHTGDVGYLDDEGYLHLVDRVARMIKSRGIKVYPAAIEGVLLEDTAVAQASVYGVVDTDAVEHVYATVVPYEGAAVDPERLCAAVERKLSGTHVPARIIVRDKLPLLDSGKPDERSLRFEAEVAAGWRQPSG